MFELGVIAIVNENDTVAIDELKFGDNDTFSSYVKPLSCKMHDFLHYAIPKNICAKVHIIVFQQLSTVARSLHSSWGSRALFDKRVGWGLGP